MSQGLKAGTHRKLEQRDNMIDGIIRDYSASRGLKLTDELPPEKTHAELLAKAGGRSFKLAC